MLERERERELLLEEANLAHIFPALERERGRILIMDGYGYF